MKNRQIRNSLLLVLTALIWGSAFVAQRKGGDVVGPFTFNGIRSFIGSAVLVPVILVLNRVKPSEKTPKTPAEKTVLLYPAGADHKSVSEEEMRLEYLGRHGNHSDWIISSVYDGFPTVSGE